MKVMYRIPTRPGKPGKMRVHLENLEISWNFEKFHTNHGKMIENLEKTGCALKFPPKSTKLLKNAGRKGY